MNKKRSAGFCEGKEARKIQYEKFRKVRLSPTFGVWRLLFIELWPKPGWPSYDILELSGLIAENCN